MVGTHLFHQHWMNGGNGATLEETGPGSNPANEDKDSNHKVKIFNKAQTAKWWEIDVQEDSNTSQPHLNELQPHVQYLTRPFFNTE